MAGNPGLLDLLRQLQLPGLVAGLAAGAAGGLAVLWPALSPRRPGGAHTKGIEGWGAAWPRLASLRERIRATGVWSVAATALGAPAGAFLLGAGLFLPAALVQIPLVRALSAWQAQVSPGSSPLLLSLLPALAAGLVQEPVKLGAVLAAGRWWARVKQGTPGGAVPAAAMAGAGFAAVGAARVLSAAFAAASAYRHLGPPSLAVAVLEEVVMAFYHAASCCLLAGAWSRSPRAALAVLGALIWAHGLLAYLRVLAGVGSLNLWGTVLLGAIISLGLVSYGPVAVRPRGRPAFLGTTGSPGGK